MGCKHFNTDRKIVDRKGENVKKKKILMTLKTFSNFNFINKLTYFLKKS